MHTNAHGKTYRHFLPDISTTSCIYMCVCVLCRVLSKVPGWDFAPFSSLIWSECCSAPDKTSVCSKLDGGVGRQIWEIFITLDVDSQVKITTVKMSKCT